MQAIRLVLSNGEFSWGSVDSLEKLSLFQSRPELLNCGEYRIMSDVSHEVLDLFLARVFGSSWTLPVTEENAEPLQALCDEFGYTGFDPEIQAILGENGTKTQRELLSLTGRVDRHDVLLDKLQRQDTARKLQMAISQRAVDDLLLKFESRIEKMEEAIESCLGKVTGHIECVGTKIEKLESDVAVLKVGKARLEDEARLSRDGLAELRRARHEKCVFAWLRKMEKKFEGRQAIVRLSSNDLYRMLDPASSAGWGSRDSEGAWFEIEFKSPVRVNGLEVTSSRVGGALRTFDVIFLSQDNNGASSEAKVVSFVDEAGLNGKGLSVRKEFDPVVTTGVRVQSRGENWSGKHFMNIGGLELFSPDAEYQEGVFHSIFAKDRDHVWERFDVRAREFDESSLHISDGRNVGTLPGDHEWVEVGLLHGRLILSKYRIQKDKGCLRGWTLRGSNDRNEPLDEWDVIHSFHEDSETLEVIEFECVSSTPYRFFRIVQEEQRWDGGSRLKMKYFDMDGLFIPD